MNSHPQNKNQVFHGILSWEHLKTIFSKIDSSYYFYDLREPPPSQNIGNNHNNILDVLYNLLQREHNEDYCGIVYVDDLEQPNIVKIFDPSLLGGSCSKSTEPLLPGWIISKEKPLKIENNLVKTNSRHQFYLKLITAVDNRNN